MFTRNCREEITDPALYCPKCGVKLELQEQKDTQENQQPASKRKLTGNPKNKFT